jgi:hypothetical protein
MMPKTNPKEFVNTWRFVDSSDKESRKQSRLHAVRESARKHRWLQEKRQSKSGDEKSPIRPSYGRTAGSVTSEDGDSTSDSPDTSQGNSQIVLRHRWPFSRKSSPLGKHDFASPSNSPSSSFPPSPKSVLAAGSIDPFEAFPVPNTNRHVDSLADFCEPLYHF